MAMLGEFLGREAGQKRRKWLDETVGNTLSYFLGPTGIDDRLNAVAMVNPVNDVGEAMQNSRVMMDGSRSGRERFDAGVDMATNMAAVLAPVVAGKMAGGADEAADVVDALLGFGGPTREAATDYAKRFAGDEAGNIRLPIGDAVETRGSDILDLLRNGRAGEVTDEMLDLGDPTLNARLNEYLFNNYDLPMDEASRMARAREMGFDTDAPLFHGGNPEILGFNQSEYGVLGSGVYTARNPEGAAEYAVGGSTYPLSARTTTSATEKDFSEELAKIYKDKGFIGYGPQSKATTEALTARGYGSIADDDVVNTFDPRNIRSRFARFDPRLSHLRNLSAGAAGLGILGGANMQNDDNQPLRAYLGL